jgi:two-component system, sensor histidine kinase LadS
MQNKNILRSLAIIPIAFIVFASPLRGDGIPPVVITGERGDFPLGRHLEVFEDVDKNLTINEISAPAYSMRFRPVGMDLPRFGYTTSAIWVRFSIRNTLPHTLYFLIELDYPPIDHAALFIPREGGGFDTLLQGDHEPQGDNTALNEKPLFPLQLAAGAVHTYFMRIETEGSMQVILTAWMPPAFLVRNTIEKFIFGSYFGIMLVMCAYHLFLFFSLRDRAYLAYVMHMLGTGLWLFSKTGMLYAHVLPEHPFLANVLGLTGIYVAVMGALVFFLLFLNTRKTMPPMDWIFKALALLAACGMAGSFFLPYQPMMMLATALAMLAAVIAIPSGLYTLWKRYTPARFFVLAWLAFMIVAFLVPLADMGVISGLLLSKYALLAGSTLQVTLMSFALGDRIHLIRKENEEVKNGVLRIQREATESLELRVEARTRKLSEANRKLTELDRAKSRFFATISHELRTPLTLIIAPVESALNDGACGVDRAALESIQRNAEKLLSLINDLLDLSRIDAGRMKLLVECVDAVSLVRTRVAMMDAACRTRGITVSVCTPGDPVYVWVDAKRIGQVVDNLLSNAIKFTGDGGRVAVSVEGAARACMITVEDNGMGIARDHLEAIFDRFVQGDQSNEKRFGGSGIGLSLVREFTELHDGAVQVVSLDEKSHPDNHGARFTVTLHKGREHFDGRADVEYAEEMERPPFQDPSPFTRPEGEAGRESTRGAEDAEHSILVVEDHADMRGLIARILGAGCSVIEAGNGAEALRLLDSMKEPPDLVLTDVMMPEMGGIELAQKMSADDRFAGIPVIVLSARADMEMKMEGFDSGVIDYIVKPFNARELKARVAVQLKMKSLRDRLERTNRDLYGRLHEQACGKRTMSPSAEEKMRAVEEFIRANFRSDISRDGLAAAVDMSPDHLSRAFNRLFGKKIPDFISETRIREAVRRMDESDDTILHIAFEVGFENLRTFNRAFLKIMGMTPSGYRVGKN